MTYNSSKTGAQVDAAVDKADSALQPTDFTNTPAEIDAATDKVQVATGTLLHTGNTPIQPNATDLELSPGAGLLVGGTGAANLLEVYESGTFPLTLIDAGTGLTLASVDATYVRVGDIAHISCHIEFFTNTTATGAVKISTPAPFASAAPSMLSVGGPMRGFSVETRELGPCVVVAGGTRTTGGTGMYTILMNQAVNSSGYDAIDGAWIRDSVFDSPGLFISGGYKIA